VCRDVTKESSYEHGRSPKQLFLLNADKSGAVAVDPDEYVVESVKCSLSDVQVATCTSDIIIVNLTVDVHYYQCCSFGIIFWY